MNYYRKQKRVFKYGILFLLIFLICIPLTSCQSSEQTYEWIVTQHGWWEGRQMTFYTIANDNGYLIVVDGGSGEDAERFREIIREKGNHINLWILTHPHFDHVGAFIEVWPSLGDITVDKVIMSEFPALEKALASGSVNPLEAYQEFYTLDLSTVKIVEMGDELTVSNLNLRVLNTWGEHVEETGVDFLNNGGLMFMISGNENSILFCADVRHYMSDWLIATYGEELSADFVQLGHHGNGSSTLPSDFLDIVSPEVAFFDAPEWLFEDPDGRFEMDWIIEYMHENNIVYYNFQTAPNSIIFR